MNDDRQVIKIIQTAPKNAMFVGISTIKERANAASLAMVGLSVTIVVIEWTIYIRNSLEQCFFAVFGHNSS